MLSRYQNAAAASREYAERPWATSIINLVRWPAKKVRHHLNVSVIKPLITHLDFDVAEK
jgi:hypothetical protein